MSTAVSIPIGEDAFCLWQVMCPELFCQPVKEELLDLLGQVLVRCSCEALGFSWVWGRGYLTSSQTRNVPMIGHNLPCLLLL